MGLTLDENKKVDTPTPRVDVYAIISEVWGIPKARVKTLICLGAYGMAGSEKSEEQWREQLAAWDGDSGLAQPVQPKPKKGRFGGTFWKPTPKRT